MRVLTDITELKGPCCAAIGYFDGVHLGHASVIGAAVNMARKTGLPSVVISFDMSAVRSSGKGNKDLFTFDERKERIAALGPDALLMLDFFSIRDMSGRRFTEEVLHSGVEARYISCGADFHFAKDKACSAYNLKALCAPLGIDVELCSPVSDSAEVISTTRIKRLISLGDTDAASRLLCRPYGFTLRVYEEKHLARKLGFPTINQRFPDVTLPRFGVYHTLAQVDGVWRDSISNIGVRPSVDSDNNVVLETHVIDWSGDLYGQLVSVIFMRFMRSELKFESIDELRAQVERDIASVMASRD